MKSGLFFFIFLLVVTIETPAQDCPVVKLSDFPKNDLPTTVQKLQLKRQKKESGDYYYGIGVPVNYVTARHLAFIELDASDYDEPFKGPSILLMIYANGFGVKRDLDLCIRLACANVGGATAEVDGRVDHLKGMKEEVSRDTFDICDDITSGLMMGFCQSRASKLADVKRNAEVRKITGAWSPIEKDAFLKLKKATDNFINTRVTLEVDLSGTARAMFVLEEEDTLKDEFLTAIKLVDKCTFPDCSEKDFVKTDKELNAVYSAVMRDSGYMNTAVYGTVTKSGVIKTQRAWLKYEDAWVKFAAIKCPHIPAIVFKSYFTKQRILQLKDPDEDSN